MTKEELEEENVELKEKLNRYEHDCPSCSAFGKHCPHRVNGDPYFYDCYLTVTELEAENANLKIYNEKLLTSDIEKHNKIAELKAQIEKMKAQYDYAFNQLCESREILCSMLSQYRDRKEIDYSTRECGEKLLKEGVYKND